MKIKRQKSRWATAALFALAGWACASCVRDHIGPEQGPGRNVEVDLLLHARGADIPASRSVATDREAQVDNVLALFFDGQTAESKLYAVSQGRNLTPGPDGTDNHTVTFRTSLAVAAGDENKFFACLVVANCLDRTLDDGSTLSLEALKGQINTLSRARAQELLTLAVTGKPQSDPDELFPMSGYTDRPLVPSAAAGKTFAAALLRDIARVDVVNNAATDFTLSEVYLFKPNDKRAVVPLDGAFPQGVATQVTSPSVPQGTNPIGTPWQYEVKGQKTSHEIYLPEADVRMGANAAPGDANHTKRCAVVVGGLYKNTMNYYRIDFNKTRDGGGADLMDVLRNHSYNIVITAVRSGGETTPEDAYKAVSSDIAADIIEWTDNNQDIVFDGTNWASVECKRVEMGDGKDLQALVSLLSNLPPSSWTMQLGENATPSSERTVDSQFFSVTKPADNPDPDATIQGGDLVIRTREQNPQGGTPRQETLHIFIGRLEIIITLIQNPYQDVPWQDGGNFDGEF